MKYRADIDGLRAIAVLAVVIFHFKHSVVPNGYLGVDIFFVISGFLITNIIQNELNTGQFTLRGFYERRIRRIFPAFITVLSISSIVAYNLFLPNELLPFAKSTIASLFFTSNILFYTETGYFDAAAELKPLMHTWSLAVEEQFYIVFPLLMIALHKWAKTWIKPVIIILFCLSALANLIVTFPLNDTDSAFFMFHLRAWELLAGSILALQVLPEHWLTRMRANFMHSLGIILILGSFYLPKTMLFDIMTTILPIKPFTSFGHAQYLISLNFSAILGTFLVIYAGTPNNNTPLPAKILGSKIPVFFGKISYSLYLWHWPIYVFALYYMLNDLTDIHIVGLILFSVIISYISWRYIEQPLRDKKLKLQHSKFIYGGILSAILIIICSLWLIHKNGKAHWHTASHGLDTPVTISGDYPQAETFNESLADRYLGRSTALNEQSFVLLGDSHAKAISPSLHMNAIRHTKNGLMISNECLAQSEFTDLSSNNEFQACGEKTDQFITFLKEYPNIKTVFIAQRWTGRTKSLSTKYSIEFPFKFREESLTHLINNIEALNRHVVILAQVPLLKTTENNVVSLYTRMKMFGMDTKSLINATLGHHREIQKNMLPIYDKVTKKTSADILYPETLLCEENNPDAPCIFSDEDGFYYYDTDHISTYGAEKLSPLFAPYFQ